jgi:hypothetical protein
MNWWALPGPHRFVDSVIEDIREGKSVFLCLPENCPPRLTTHIRQTLEEDYRWLQASPDPGIAPIDFIYDFAVQNARPERLRNLGNLVLEAEFLNRVICLEELPASDWAAWIEFFTDYEHICRAVPEARRTYFIARMSNPCSRLPSPMPVGLSVRRWDGWVNRRDMQLYSTSCVRQRKTELETDLVMALVSVLAGWDPELCEFLAEFELSELLVPANLLRGYAEKTRGWGTFISPRLDEQSWSQGLWQTYLGKPQPHTCFAAFLNGSRHLDKSIWRAEIGVLMPYIEEARQKLIERYRPYFKLPFYTKTGVVDDVYDLEIGTIELMLSRTELLRSDPLKMYVSDLKGVRNKLSHFAPAETEVLLRLCQANDKN